MDYTQAEREFWRLEGLRRAGQIGEDAYRAQLNALSVLDEWGRPWMLQEQTGQWFVLHEGQWVASTPPGHTPMPPPISAQFAAPVQQPPALASYGPAAQASQPLVAGVARASVPPTLGSARPTRARRKLGCTGVTLRILLWDLVWVGAAYALYTYIGPRMLWAYIGVGLLALATLFFWVRGMGRGRTLKAQGVTR
jgi:hypothetical protein